MGGNALVWVTFIVIQLVHVYINLIDYCWYTVLWDHIRDATWYLIWSNTGHLTFIWLYGFGGQNEGVVWRVVEKEVRERGCNLFRSFAWTFYAWSIPFVSKYNMSNKRKTAPSVKYGETSKFYSYSCIHMSFFYYNLYAPKHEAKSISLAY